MEKKLEKVVDSLWTLKYRNIIAYDIAESGVSKFLVVATSISTNENKKCATQLANEIKYEDKIDGWHKGEWITFDLTDIVIHLFASGFRERYNIDKLYKGKEIILNKTNKKKKA